MKRSFRLQLFVCSNKIKNRKLVGLSLIAFVLVMAVAVVEAQQPKKIPRIGYLSRSIQLLIPPVLREFGRLCANLAT